MELDDQLNTLTLLLPSEPALNQSQQQLQQLKAQVLLSRLKQQSNPAYTYNVYPRQDRIELSLSWAADNPAPNIESLVSQLRHPVEASRWQEVLKKLQARDYLNGKDIEAQAVERFFISFQPSLAEILPALPSSYANLFSGIKYVISGENSEEIATQLTQTHAGISPIAHSSVTTPIATTGRLISEESDAYVFLIGEAIPARADTKFAEQRLTAQVLQSLLESQQEKYQFKYRLLWGALKTTGYRAVILTASQSPQAILPQLQQLVNDDLVESAQNHLVIQWQDRMRDLKNQIQAMNLIAYYDLPVTTMEDYVEQVQDLDEDEMVVLARKALDTDQHINIMLSPAY